MLREFEHMRETLFDLSKDECTKLFQSLRDDEDCELGRLARRILYSAIQNYNEERSDENADSREVDAKIDRTLHGRDF